MDVDYREAFYKQTSRTDRVFDGDENSGAGRHTPGGKLIILENYDEHASLDEMLFGM